MWPNVCCFFCSLVVFVGVVLCWCVCLGGGGGISFVFVFIGMGVVILFVGFVLKGAGQFST